MERTHLPVSPLVAPTTVNLSFSFSPFAIFTLFLLSKKNSNKFPRSCKATSLNANVGPCHNSKTNFFSPICLRGVTSGCLNVSYDLSTSLLRSDSEISSWEM